jgi:hypothetical protein
MVAGLAFHYFKEKRLAPLSLNADPNLPLDQDS